MENIVGLFPKLALLGSVKNIVRTIPEIKTTLCLTSKTNT